MVLFPTNNEAYVGQGLSLDLVRLREFGAKDIKMTSTFVRSIVDNQ